MKSFASCDTWVQKLESSQDEGKYEEVTFGLVGNVRLALAARSIVPSCAALRKKKKCDS
jgi:hypothetical protein